MKNFRHRIEHYFEDFARLTYHHRIKTLVLMGLLIAATLSQLPNISMDMSTEGFLHEHDPALQAYDRFREQFGGMS